MIFVKCSYQRIIVSISGLLKEGMTPLDLWDESDLMGKLEIIKAIEGSLQLKNYI